MIFIIIVIIFIINIVIIIDKPKYIFILCGCSLFVGALYIANKLVIPVKKQGIVAQYMDYQCNPITGKKIQFYSKYISYLHRKRFVNEVITDQNGYALFDLEDADDLIIMTKGNWQGDEKISLVRELALNHRGRDYGKEARLARSSSLQDPIIIYPYETYSSNGNRKYRKEQIRVSSMNDTARYTTISDGPNNTEGVIKLKVTQKNNFYQVDLFGHRGGGLIEVPDEVSFSEKIPILSYQRKLQLTIPMSMTFPKQQQHRYYFKSERGRGYGTLTLNFSIIDDLLILNSFLTGVFQDSKTNKALQLPIIMPQEKCGGIIARHHSGYYGNINLETYHAQKKRHEYLYKPAISQEEQVKRTERALLEKVAKDISTPDEWFINIGPDVALAKIALDNNAPISSRIKTLFEINYTTPSNQLMTQIKRDPRTPLSVLNRLEEKGYQLPLGKTPIPPSTKPFKKVITEFYDDSRIKKLGNALLFDDAKIKRYGGEILASPNTSIEVLNKFYGVSESLDRRIASHPNIDENLAFKIIDDAQSKYLNARIAVNPATPQSVLLRLYNGDIMVMDEIHSTHWDLPLYLYCNPSLPTELRYRLPFMLNSDCSNSRVRRMLR